jgi:hypothetical protein
MCIFPGEWHFNDVLVLELLFVSTASALPSSLAVFHVVAFQPLPP